MFIRTLIATAAAAGLMASAANALTVVNTDKTAHAFVYTPKGGKAQHVSLKGHKSRTLSCSYGGEFAMGKDTMACTANTGKIWIKNGKFGS